MLPCLLLRLSAVVTCVEAKECHRHWRLLLAWLEFLDVCNLRLEQRHAEEAPELDLLLRVWSVLARTVNYVPKGISYRAKVRNQVLVASLRHTVEQVLDRRLHGNHVEDRLDDWVIRLGLENGLVDLLVGVAVAEPRNDAQELPCKLPRREDLIHAGVAHRVLRKQSQHLHPIRIDDAFEDLAPRWRLLILAEPLGCKPRHFILAVEKRVVFTTLLPLRRFDWMLILVED